jgi:hypothetical protein
VPQPRQTPFSRELAGHGRNPNRAV